MEIQSSLLLATSRNTHASILSLIVQYTPYSALISKYYLGRHSIKLNICYLNLYLPGFELGHINKELRNVAEWYSLGTNLGLSKDDLDIIRQDVGKEGVMQCRLEMLSLWYNRCASVSWPELISALVLTGRRRLAHKLALKYRELQ